MQFPVGAHRTVRSESFFFHLSVVGRSLDQHGPPTARLGRGPPNRMPRTTLWSALSCAFAAAAAAVAAASEFTLRPAGCRASPVVIRRLLTGTVDDNPANRFNHCLILIQRFQAQMALKRHEFSRTACEMRLSASAVIGLRF